MLPIEQLLCQPKIFPLSTLLFILLHISNIF